MLALWRRTSDRPLFIVRPALDGRAPSVSSTLASFSYVCNAHYFYSQLRIFSLQIDKFGVDSVDVREVLLEMRKYRMGLIQTPDQLRFSYQAIIEGAKQLRSPNSEVRE